MDEIAQHPFAEERVRVQEDAEVEITGGGAGDNGGR